MASGAQWSQRLGKHPLDIASMRFMAREAHPLYKRIVIHPACQLFHEICVTLNAQFPLDSLEQILLGGSMRNVTGITVCVSHGLMRIGLQELGFSIRMTLVTDRIQSVLDDMLDI